VPQPADAHSQVLQKAKSKAEASFQLSQSAMKQQTWDFHPDAPHPQKVMMLSVTDPLN
jgi:hypothetical protein